MNEATEAFIDAIIETSKTVREETYKMGEGFNPVIEFVKNGKSVGTVFVPPFGNDEEKVHAFGKSLFATQAQPSMEMDTIIGIIDSWYVSRSASDLESDEFVRPKDDPNALDAIMIMVCTEDEMRGIILPYEFNDDNTITWHERVVMPDNEAHAGFIPSLMRSALVNGVTYPTTRNDYRALITHSGGHVVWPDDDHDLTTLLNQLLEGWNGVVEGGIQ